MKKINMLSGLLVGAVFAQSSWAVDCSNLDTWLSSEVYNGGREVQFNQKAYQAKWWTQNQNPEMFSRQWDVWRLLGDCSGGGGGSNQSPLANANGPYSGVEDTVISFSSEGSDDPDGFIASYRWSFGDGESSDLPNPDHSYANAGSYTVTLTVTDDRGASDTASSVATISGSGGGGGNPGNCSGVADYVAGTTYAAGDRVANFVDILDQTVEFECVIAGWCSSSATWAYEPGNGTYWEDAWDEVGPCGGGSGNQDPVAEVNGPYFGNENETLSFSSNGSRDPDGEITSYAWNFGDGQTSDAVNPSHVYASSGVYTVTLTVTDNEGASVTDSTTATISGSGGGGSGNLPRRALIGYWHNFTNEAGYLPIAQVSDDWDIVNIAFAENDRFGQEGEMVFSPADESEASFRAGISALKARGQKVLISIGGANAHIQLNSAASRDNFVRTMGDIIARYGFDGMDIDLEGGSMFMQPGDTIANPRTPAIVNLISATRSIKARFGSGFILTMAPETAFVQGGYTAFGGSWGAYLPLIHALRNDLTVLHVQHYNTGGLRATDDKEYAAGTADFHVALSDMMITGFVAGGDPSNFFPGLRADQVAFGLPATGGAAGSGQTDAATTQRALDCLIRLVNCGSYRPARAHDNFRGLMTWSITWDALRGFPFSTPHRRYLDQNP